MQLSKRAKLSAAIWSAAFGTTAFGGATIQLVGNTTLPNSWPVSPFTANLPVIDSGDNGAQGSPASVTANEGGPGGTNFNNNETINPTFAEAETFTPTVNFNLGAISFIESGAGVSDPADFPDPSGIPYSMHLFQLSSNTTGTSTGYVLNTASVSGDLLGGGAGLNFFFNNQPETITEYDFNKTGTNDQVPLIAGDTYTLELWNQDPNGVYPFYMSRTDGVQTYPGGQVLAGGDGSSADTQSPTSTVVRGTVVGNASANLMFAIYAAGGVSASNGNWLATTSESWANSANWSNAYIPHLAGDVANFASATGGATTVTLDANWTVGQIAFNNTNSYTLAPGTGGSLTLDNGGTSATATVTNTSGSHSISAPIVLNSTGSFIVSNATGVLTISGNISGNNTFVSGGAGTVFLTGTNTYNGGGTQITSGTLRVGSATALRATSPAVISTGATLDLNGFSPTISTLFGDGIIDDVAGGGTSILTNGSSASSTFSGVIRNTSGAVGINFVGTGSLLMTARTAANTYTGGTTISAGTVLIGVTQAMPVGGTVVNNSNFVVQAGAAGAPVVLGNVSGSGTLFVGNSSVGSAGFVQLAAGSGADTQGTLNISTGSTLDITNNKLVLNYGAAANDPKGAVVAALVSGYNNVGASPALWTGTGIISSTAASNPSKFSIGYLDGNVTADTTAKNIGANQFKIAYVLAGDAFLENSVGFDDLVVVAQNFGATGKDWAGGNFNYDPAGAVGFTDLVNVAQNFGFVSGVSQGSGGGNVSAAWQSVQGQSPIPEPATVSLLAAAAAGMLARRKRR